MNNNASIIEYHRPAFFALLAERIADRIVREGAEVARMHGLTVSARSMSTLLSLARSPKGVAALADELNISHAAAIKITKGLILDEYVIVKVDKKDRRRRPLSLTPKGERMAKKIDQFMSTVATTYESLFAEIETDAYTVLLDLENALVEQSFHDRLLSAQHVT